MANLAQAQKPYYAREWERVFYLARLADFHYLSRLLDPLVADKSTRQALTDIHDVQLQRLVDIIAHVGIYLLRKTIFTYLII